MNGIAHEIYVAIALVSPEIYFNVLHTVMNNLIESQLYTANAAAFVFYAPYTIYVELDILYVIICYTLCRQRRIK